MTKTILLLICSNAFMTIAWYYHLGNTHWSFLKALTISWGIAFIEYCFVIPANRIGYKSGLGLFELKVTQEVVSLVVFVIYAIFFANSVWHWKYLVSFVCLIGSVYFVFADFK